MPRLPLLPAEPEDDIVAEVFRLASQEWQQPIALYRTLAHSPRLLRAYAATAR
jgi:hypothetical protein